MVLVVVAYVVAEVVMEGRAVVGVIVGELEHHVRHVRGAVVVHAQDIATQVVSKFVARIGIAGGDQAAGVVVVPGDDADRVVELVEPGLAGAQAEVVVSEGALQAVAVDDADDLAGDVVAVDDRVADFEQPPGVVIDVAGLIADRVRDLGELAVEVILEERRPRDRFSLDRESRAIGPAGPSLLWKITLAV